mmetsp:Transcript_30531/g.87556  ORF Transcript_30531/g.87556 Transcript_30531/m.87556 type:complete len:233 (+) Transcript_30531:470-1168(+)
MLGVGPAHLTGDWQSVQRQEVLLGADPYGPLPDSAGLGPLEDLQLQERPAGQLLQGGRRLHDAQRCGSAGRVVRVDCLGQQRVERRDQVEAQIGFKHLRVRLQRARLGLREALWPQQEPGIVLERRQAGGLGGLLHGRHRALPRLLQPLRRLRLQRCHGRLLLPGARGAGLPRPEPPAAGPAALRGGPGGGRRVLLRLGLPLQRVVSVGLHAPGLPGSRFRGAVGVGLPGDR